MSRGSAPALLYVGTLPPHPGGSAILSAGVLCGLVGRGWNVRSVAPITREAIELGDPFSDQHPELHIRRFVVPHFESAPNQPASEEYRRHEGRLIRGALDDLISDQRPDVILIGRETFAWHVPDIARTRNIPCVLMVQGAWRLFDLSRGPRSPRQVSTRLLNQSRNSLDRISGVDDPFAPPSPYDLGGLVQLVPNDLGLPLDVDSFGTDIAYVANALP
jgi:hypothetical protein